MNGKAKPKDQVDVDIRRADKIFSGHVLRNQEDRRVLIGIADLGSSQYWTEIIMGARGTLFVHGDAPSIVFRSWDSGLSFEGILNWAGYSDLGYMCPKIVMGEKTIYQGARAREDVRSMAKEYYEPGDRRRNRLLKLADSKKSYWEDGADGADLRLHDDLVTIDWELSECFPIGRRPSMNFIMAMAACRRASTLLKAKAA